VEFIETPEELRSQYNHLPGPDGSAAGAAILHSSHAGGRRSPLCPGLSCRRGTLRVIPFCRFATPLLGRARSGCLQSVCSQPARRPAFHRRLSTIFSITRESGSDWALWARRHVHHGLARSAVLNNSRHGATGKARACVASTRRIAYETLRRLWVRAAFRLVQTRRETPKPPPVNGFPAGNSKCNSPVASTLTGPFRKSPSSLGALTSASDLRRPLSSGANTEGQISGIL